MGSHSVARPGVSSAWSAYSPGYYRLPDCPHCGGRYDLDRVVEGMPYFRGAAVKYLVRAGRKRSAFEVQDLGKAENCARLEKERMGR